MTSFPIPGVTKWQRLRYFFFFQFYSRSVAVRKRPTWCDSTEKTLKTVPDWFLDPPQKSDYLFATSSMTSKDMQLSIQKAKTVAQADLAQQLETRTGNLTRQFREEIGEGEDSDLMQEFTQPRKRLQIRL